MSRKKGEKVRKKKRRTTVHDRTLGTLDGFNFSRTCPVCQHRPCDPGCPVGFTEAALDYYAGELAKFDRRGSDG